MSEARTIKIENTDISLVDLYIEYYKKLYNTYLLNETSADASSHAATVALSLIHDVVSYDLN